MSVGEIAPQLNATKGADARRERRWIVLATTSLPVPLWPVTRTGALETATRRMASKTLTIEGDLPMSSPSFPVSWSSARSVSTSDSSERRAESLWNTTSSCAGRRGLSR